MGATVCRTSPEPAGCRPGCARTRGMLPGDDGLDWPRGWNPDVRRFGLAARFAHVQSRGADRLSSIATPGVGAGGGARGVAAVRAGRDYLKGRTCPSPTTSAGFVGGEACLARHWFGYY